MKRLPADLSKDQKFCADILGVVFGGRHHLPKIYKFGYGICINHSGDLSTFDWDKLTMLVLAAHHYAVRIEIASSGPRMVKIICHRRKHGSSLYRHERHPSSEDLIQRIDSLSKILPAIE